MESNQLQTSALTVIDSSVSINGVLETAHELHFYGRLVGELQGMEGSTILLKEGSLVDGKITSYILIVDGFVKGEIIATQRVWITSRGRVLGSVKTPSLQVDPGAIFEAKVKM